MIYQSLNRTRIVERLRYHRTAAIAGWVAKHVGGCLGGWQPLRIGQILAFCGVVFFAGSASAQWQNQSLALKPGWNAVFLHVNASHISLSELVSDPANPVTEVWRWNPRIGAAQFLNAPDDSIAPNSQWTTWTRSADIPNTLRRLTANAAYLVHNGSGTGFNWTIKGTPELPDYRWSVDGLNFVGFPIPAGAAVSFQDYFGALPGDLGNQAEVYRYEGADLSAGNPRRVPAFVQASTTVNRGEAYWLRSDGDSLDRHFSPLEVEYTHPKGLRFGDESSVSGLRIRNVSSVPTTVSFRLSASESAPVGQSAVLAPPPLLVRGALDRSDLSYPARALDGTTPYTVDLPAAGEPGAEVEVVFGLNRALMDAPAGSLYAGILSVEDSGGRVQSGISVSALSASEGGLWVGEAKITGVGQYLLEYPKSFSVGTLAAIARTNNINNLALPGTAWETHNAGVSLAVLAASQDGMRLFGAQSPGRLYTSADGGATWVRRSTGRTAGDRNWSAVASSGDGERLVAAVEGGKIWTSINGGLNWVEQAAGAGSKLWQAVASSADGRKLVAVADGLKIYTSSDGGNTWVARDSARAWRAVVSSEDGSRWAAAATDALYVSTDSGVTWNHRSAAPSGIAAMLSSDDGLQLVAMVGREVHHSSDGGLSWDVLSVPTGASNTLRALTGSLDLQRLVTVDDANQYHVSSDGGANWVTRPFVLAGHLTASAISGNGSKLLLARSTGVLWTSDSSGSAWQARNENRKWQAVASSSDGTKLLAAGRVTRLYTSADSGTTWTPAGESAAWDSVASSSDGTKLVAASAAGRVYTSADSGATWRQRTRSNYLSLDGANAHGQLPAGVYFDGGSFTVEAWVYARSHRNWARLIDFHTDAPADGVWMALSEARTGRPTAGVFRGNDGGNHLMNTTGLALGTWVHLAFVFDNEANGATGTMTVYLDGVAKTSGTVNAPNAVTRARCYVGKSRFTQSELANAGIDDLRIWSAARTAAELAEGMTNSYTTNTAGLEAQFTFDRIVNGSALDSSGNGRDMALAGGADLHVLSGTGVAVTSSTDGGKLVAVVNGGRVLHSADSGLTWVSRDQERAWSSVASSADGFKLLGSVAGGSLYTSADSGVSWVERRNDLTRSWSAVASSADGTKLAGVVAGGLVHTSVDSGVTWLSRDTVREWTSVAASIDGSKLVATTTNAVYTSVDSGGTWTGRDLTDISDWALAASGDGSRLMALPQGQTGLSLVSDGHYLSYEADPISGLVRVRGPAGITNITTGLNTAMAPVPQPYPLRLIVHHDGSNNGGANLFQRIYLGQRPGGTSFAVTPYESLLDPARLAAARRISATHMPYSRTNSYWASASGSFGGSLVFNVDLDYRDHSSNPFLHGFHPDHDNLTADFKRVQVSGTESYGVRRRIKLSFGSGAEDFRSLTESGRLFSGTYREDISLSGPAGGAGRTYHVEGIFTLYRVLERSTLTTSAATPADTN
jgi:hypothetical protein